MILDKGDRWWDFAACRGRAPLFDHDHDGRPPGGSRRSAEKAADLARYEDAADVCSACRVREFCRADYRPGRDEGIRFGQLLPPIDMGRTRGGPVQTSPDHGTEAGYQRHQRRHEKACDACVLGQRLARERRARRKAS